MKSMDGKEKKKEFEKFYLIYHKKYKYNNNNNNNNNNNKNKIKTILKFIHFQNFRSCLVFEKFKEKCKGKKIRRKSERKKESNEE